jgi:hypothetical protein
VLRFPFPFGRQGVAFATGGGQGDALWSDREHGLDSPLLMAVKALFFLDMPCGHSPLGQSQSARPLTTCCTLVSARRRTMATLAATAATPPATSATAAATTAGLCCVLNFHSADRAQPLSPMGTKEIAFGFSMASTIASYTQPCELHPALRPEPGSACFAPRLAPTPPWQPLPSGRR